MPSMSAPLVTARRRSGRPRARTRSWSSAAGPAGRARSAPIRTTPWWWRMAPRRGPMAVRRPGRAPGGHAGGAGLVRCPGTISWPPTRPGGSRWEPGRSSSSDGGAGGGRGAHRGYHFDFRQVHGELDAEAPLRRIAGQAAGNRRFLGRLAVATRRWPPPLGCRWRPITARPGPPPTSPPPSSTCNSCACATRPVDWPRERSGRCRPPGRAHRAPAPLAQGHGPSYIAPARRASGSPTGPT